MTIVQCNFGMFTAFNMGVRTTLFFLGGGGGGGERGVQLFIHACFNALYSFLLLHFVAADG